MASILRSISDRIADARERFAFHKFEKRRLEKPVSVAIIGTGKAAQYHLHVLDHIEGVSVACIVNRGNSDPTDLMDSHGIPQSFVGVERALEACRIDAAIVAVDIPSTFEVANTLFAHGVDCLIEKPLAATLEQAEALTGLQHRMGVRSAVAYNRRFYSSVRRAAEIVELLGPPYAIHVDSPESLAKIQKSGESVEAAQNRIVTNACHAIDLFTVFAGGHRAKMSLGLRKTFDGIRVDYTYLIEFERGCTGQFTSHWCSPGEPTVALFGPGYKLSFGLWRHRLLFERDGQMAVVDPDPLDHRFKAGVYLQDVTFLDAVSRDAPIRAPLATLESALETQRLATALRDG